MAHPTTAEHRTYADRIKSEAAATGAPLDHQLAMEAYATCDLQMLRGQHGEYVVKEFAVYEATRTADTFQVVTFAPPYPEEDVPEKYQQQNKYVTNHIHGLEWSHGDKPYEELRGMLNEMTAHIPTLYIKGAEKRRLLQTLVQSQVMDIEKLGCPALKALPFLWAPCHNENHSTAHRFACAVRNAKRIGLWLLYFPSCFATYNPQK